MFVYVITASEFCHKIGISNNPESRLSQLRTGHYQDLKLVFQAETPNALWAEQVLHGYFRNQRIRGEWFTVPVEEIIKAVKIAVEDSLTGEATGLVDVAPEEPAAPVVSSRPDVTGFDQERWRDESGHVSPPISVAMQRREASADAYRRLFVKKRPS